MSAPGKAIMVIVLDAVARLLRCPHCRGALVADGPRLVCPVGHSFDVARQGYVNLAGERSRRLRSDTADMVAARQRLLSAGHFNHLRATVADTVGRGVDGYSRTRPPVIVELGTGTGFYLAGALNVLPEAIGLGFDLSVPAVRLAARAHPRSGAVVADVWEPLPARDEVADAVLVVFAPRDLAEVKRVLRPGGVLVVASPGVDHLRELTEPLGLLGVPAGKDEASFWDSPAFETTRERYQASLSRDECCDVVAMGPSAWHADLAAVRAWADAGPPLRSVTVDVTVRTFRSDNRGNGL